MRRNTKTMYEWRKAYRDKEELMLERGFPEVSPHELPCSIGVLCRAYKGGNPYQSSFTADTGTYRLCADKVVCKRVYEVERILLN
mgnify:CR=1 FL=1